MGKSAKFAKKPSKKERETTKVIKNTQTRHKSSFPTIPKPLLKPNKPNTLAVDIDPVVSGSPTPQAAKLPTDAKELHKSDKHEKKLGIKSTDKSKGKIEKKDNKAKEKRKTLLQQLTKEVFEEPKLLDGRPDYVSLFEGKSRVARGIKKEKLLKSVKK